MSSFSGAGQVSASASASAAAFAALPRTYENALGLLAQLSTNRDITALFEVPQTQEADLNALAMPEVRAWLARAGYADLPRDLAPLRCVHVAGTKGKGSVCAFVTAILVAEAQTTTRIGRVGTYLSPHVVSVRERIWLDGQPISRDLFARYTFELWQRLSEAAAQTSSEADPFGPATKPFYFRFLTLLALHVFVREGVRSAVVECGIGGEYDVTNVLPPSVVTAAGVTRLGIDHVAMLGRTLDQIAWHKAGIFQPGVAAFTLQNTEDSAAALEVLRARALEKGAGTLREIPPALVDRWPGVPGAALHGSFQKYNMALAAALARHHLQVVGAGEQTSEEDSLDPATMPPRFLSALAGATLRGRCEAVATANIDWLVDGAHTADSLAEVARFFADGQPATATDTKTGLLFTVRDRNAADLLRAVLAGAGRPGFFDEVLVVFPPDAVDVRAAALQAVAEASPSSVAHAWDDVASAVAHIQAVAGSLGPARCRVLATGSFVLARDVLRVLDPAFEE